MCAHWKPCLDSVLYYPWNELKIPITKQLITQ